MKKKAVESVKHCGLVKCIEMPVIALDVIKKSAVQTIRVDKY